jgi:hypothetical protein
VLMVGPSTVWPWQPAPEFTVGAGVGVGEVVVFGATAGRVDETARIGVVTGVPSPAGRVPVEPEASAAPAALTRSPAEPCDGLSSSPTRPDAAVVIARAGRRRFPKELFCRVVISSPPGLLEMDVFAGDARLAETGPSCPQQALRSA